MSDVGHIGGDETARMSGLPEPPLEPLTVTVRKAAELSGLCQSTIRNSIRDKKLEARKVGSRTLVVFASLKTLLGLSGAA